MKEFNIKYLYSIIAIFPAGGIKRKSQRGEMKKKATAQSLTSKIFSLGQTFAHQIEVFADEILS